MKAFIVENESTSYIKEIEEPKIFGDSVIKVKVKACGICGTDLKIFKGQHSQSVGAKRIPGHEFAGEILEIGKNVKEFKVGDRVVHEPIDYCGECYACRKGQGNVCAEVKVTGCNMSGGMSEVYIADQKQWHKIPDWLTWEQAALIEPYTIASQICVRAGIEAGNTMLIIGAGPIGLMLADTASKFGVEVTIMEIMPGRLKLAEKIGIKHVINSNTEKLKEVKERITNGNGFNFVCDCAGVPKVDEEILEILSPAGVFVPVAGVKFNFDGYMAMRKQIKVVASRLQMKQFVPVISRFKLYEESSKKIITDVYDFSDTKKAFEFASMKNSDAGKIILRF